MRLLVLAGLLELLMRRAAMPSRAVAPLSVHGRPVPSEQALSMLAVVMLFPLAALVSWLPFLAAGMDPLDSLFDVVSALGTVGLSTGELDCGFLHGDGAKPAVLREADPEHTEYLFCFTGSDQTNIIAGLVGQSLGFRAVVPKIDDPEFEHICIELGLTHTVIPSRSVGRYLADLFEGRDPLEITAMVREDARIFSFVARAEDETTIAELGLPRTSRVVCVYSKEEFLLPDGQSRLHEGDEVIVIAQRDSIPDLEERWGRRNRAAAAGVNPSGARPQG